MNRSLFLLTLGVGLVTLGFVGPHRFTTILFVEQDAPELGFWSIILIYIFYTISSPFSVQVISKFGAKDTLAVSALLYWLYVVTLLLPQRAVMLVVSSLLGFAAAQFWSAQSLYIVNMSDSKHRGVSAGSVSALESLFSIVGVFGFGVMLDQLQLSRMSVLFIVSIACLVGPFVLRVLPDPQTKLPERREDGGLLSFAIRSPIVRRLMLVWLVPGYITGFTLGTMPLLLADRWSLSAVGAFASLFWLAPVAMSFISGITSDRVGRGRVMIAGTILSLVGSLLVLHPTAWTLAFTSLLLPVGFTVLRTNSYALLGDLAERDSHLSSLNALHWTIAGAGTLPPLVLGLFGNTTISVTGLLALTVAAIVFSFRLFTLPIATVRTKLLAEIKA